MRRNDYSAFDGTTNPKVAMRWALLDNQISWSEGFRKSSLAQVGLGPSQESQFIDDTYGCPNQDPNDPNFDPLNPTCANTDLTIQFSGNPDLDAETSETWNIGAIWKLNGVRLDFSRSTSGFWR